MSDILDRARAKLDGISTPPWRASASDYVTAPMAALDARDSLEFYDGHRLVCESCSGPDLTFIAAAPTLVQELIDEVVRLRGLR